MAHLERIIVLVDMDCFYCQVEEKLNPDIKGKPIAVVQYNEWRGGGIIAVNYPARNQGVTRHMRGNEAQKKCPEIVLCRVPNVRGKADLSKYREAGKEVANVLQTFTSIMLRASIDEAYLDITDSVNKRISTLYHEIEISELPNTNVVGCNINNFLYNTYKCHEINEANLKLIVGALITEEIRSSVYEKTGYTCSAGIAHNKILSKLACGLNKPNKQTILPHNNVKSLYETLPIKKIKSLGGKFGNSLTEDLNITYMNELEKFTEKQLQQKYDEKTGIWLYNIARGIDLEPVIPRLCPKSIGCCKRFPGKTSLQTWKDVYYWFKELSSEVSERLSQDIIEYQRKAKQMVVSYTLSINQKDTTSSRSRNLSSYDAVKIAEDAFEVLKKGNPLNDNTFKYPVTFLGLSMGKFENCKNATNIKDFFLNSTVNQGNNREESKIHTTNQNEFTCDNEIKITQTDHEDVKNISIDKNKTSFSKTKIINNEIKIKVGDVDINKIVDERNIYTPENNKNEEKLNSVSTNITTKSFIVRYLQNKSNEAEKTNIVLNKLQNVNDEEQKSDTNRSYKNMSIDICEESNGKSMENKQTSSLRENIDRYEICNDCSKHINIFEIDSHRDYHVALKIAEEQKTETRQNTVINKLKTISPKKRPIKNTELKISLKNNSICTYPSLKKFFQISNELKPLSSEYGFEKCDQCNKEIPIENIIEHLDYHEAKKLHAKINYNNVQVSDKVKIFEDKKRKNSTNDEQVNEKKFKKIETFFKPL